MSDTKRILLLVSGMSPQIITETLYALSVQHSPAWIPNEIHLITTLQGKQNALLELLEGNKHFAHFLNDYTITQPIRFDESTIHLIHPEGGQPLEDLRTPADNEAAADTITRLIRDFTHQESTELHVSLAGGRKTMGFYAGYALSLFGRPQDRLSHVLVSEGFESNKDFFYPTPDTRVIRTRDDKPLDTSKAQVWLADIPFVRLRPGLPTSLLDGIHGFSETVARARKATEQAQLELFPATRQYRVNGVPGKLSPVHMGLLLWAASRQAPISPLVDGEQSNDYAQELLSLADQHDLLLHGKTLTALEQDGMTKAFMETNISKLNNKLLENLGAELADHCKLASRQTDQGRGYALPDTLNVVINPKG